MANNNILKAAIQEVIKANGNGEITGPVLQSALLSIINHFGAGAVFAGIATPSTIPANTDVNSFYLANENGIYSNFGGYTLADNNLVIFTNTSGVWQALTPFSIKSISSIALTSSAGYVDTYTITYSDSSTSTFDVTNGQDILEWLIQNYAAGIKVYKNNKLYVSTAAATSSEVPGISTVWKEIVGSAYLDEVLDVSLDYTNIPSGAGPANSNLTNVGRFAYTNIDAVAGGHIIGLKIQVQTAGTLTVYRAKNINSSLYAETEVAVLNLQIGVTNYAIDIQLDAGEVLTFGNSSDTGVFRYISGSTNAVGGGYYNRNHSTGAWSSTAGNLNIGIDFAGTSYKSERLDDIENGLAELGFDLSALIDYFQMQIGHGSGTIPIASTLNANTSFTSNAYFYENFNILGGARITKLRINCHTAGTVSIIKASGVNSPAYTSSVLETINLTAGFNEISVDYLLASGETIGIGAPSNTAIFNYKTGEPNPIGGKLFGRNHSTGVWQLFNNDLCLGIDFEDDTIQSTLIQDIYQRLDDIENDLAGKKVSFIGDSITTYSGYITPGNATFYPNSASGITNVELTWWKQFLNKTKATLASNDSWSGSRVSNTGSGSLQNRLNVIASDTDICFVFMGTNDFGNNIGLGDISFVTPYNTSLFTGAYQNAIEQLVTNYPTTKFYFITPTSRNLGGFPTKNNTYTLSEMCDRIIDLCKLYGVEWIDTRKMGITNQNRTNYMADGLHPNVAGAKLLCDFILSQI